MPLRIAPLAGIALAFAAAPLAAEVVDTSASGFVTRDEAVVEADLKDTWLALIAPAKWWNSAHTWSGDSANLTMRPQAGGCFCERIPEDPDPDRITLEGSVEHMRVIHAFPEKALRLQGALGPLQSEPVTGVLTIALTKVDDGTRIVWEYNVGGPMRYKVADISKAVDGVMTQQLAGLAALLGRVEGPEPASETADEPEDAEPAEEPLEDAAAEPSVDQAFGDLSDG
ncbi:SRPBCC family protein [Erythrobacter sp. JK5]|uniref:SRPBCC family protein n=1 Tax=Erythrobacter sp. JK5 TaxID=2829500 RepID=UPI001BA796F9|nr:SRPBCC family protein [Erythrobacter sp. JK5]QUL38400.1 SRPBCC family protein [Erythrobacter sp. JK5]